MGLWKRSEREKVQGQRIDHLRAWAIQPPSSPKQLVPALRVLLSHNGVIALEGIRIDAEVKSAFQPYKIDTPLAIEPGTGFPISEWLYFRATDPALSILAGLFEQFAEPEICNHLYAYEDRTLLLEWHDAFSDPIYVSETVSPALVKAFCYALQVRVPLRP